MDVEYKQEWVNEQILDTDVFYLFIVHCIQAAPNIELKCLCRDVELKDKFG